MNWRAILAVLVVALVTSDAQNQQEFQEQVKKQTALDPKLKDNQKLSHFIYSVVEEYFNDEPKSNEDSDSDITTNKNHTNSNDHNNDYIPQRDLENQEIKSDPDQTTSRKESTLIGYLEPNNGSQANDETQPSRDGQSSNHIYSIHDGTSSVDVPPPTQDKTKYDFPDRDSPLLPSYSEAPSSYHSPLLYAEPSPSYGSSSSPSLDDSWQRASSGLPPPRHGSPPYNQQSLQSPTQMDNGWHQPPPGVSTPHQRKPPSHHKPENQGPPFSDSTWPNSSIVNGLNGPPPNSGQPPPPPHYYGPPPFHHGPPPYHHRPPPPHHGPPPPYHGPPPHHGPPPSHNGPPPPHHGPPPPHYGPPPLHHGPPSPHYGPSGYEWPPPSGYEWPPDHSWHRQPPSPPPSDHRSSSSQPGYEWNQPYHGPPPYWPPPPGPPPHGPPPFGPPPPHGPPPPGPPPSWPPASPTVETFLSESSLSQQNTSGYQPLHDHLSSGDKRTPPDHEFTPSQDETYNETLQNSSSLVDRTDVGSRDRSKINQEKSAIDSNTSQIFGSTKEKNDKINAQAAMPLSDDSLNENETQDLRQNKPYSYDFQAQPVRPEE